VIRRLQRTFRIYTQAPVFHIDIQVKILYVTAALLNWLLEYGDFDKENWADWVPQNNPLDNLGENLFDRNELTGSADSMMSLLRNKIAREMWVDYCKYLIKRSEI
jgi:hypothetical protein